MTRPTFTEARIALHRHVSLWETPESVRNIHHISDRPSSTEAPLIWLRKFAMGFLVAFMVVGGMPLTVMAVWGAVR